MMELIKTEKPIDFIKLANRYNKPPALTRILAMIEETGCRAVFVENAPSGETEYAAEYEQFYKTVFSTANNPDVDRLHFFKGDISSEVDVENADARYLGYCDIRPIRSRAISEAIISESVFIKSNSDFLFLVCKTTFEIQFSGVTLHVTGFPYVQQDGRIIRCAQAALTSIAKFYDEKLTGPSFTKVVEELSKHRRAIPSTGMTGEHIGASWSKLQKDPVLYDYLRVDDKLAASQHREQIIYRYLESGIPVLIGIDAGAEMHALVVIGHTFTPDSWLAQTKTVYYGQDRTGVSYHCCTNWIERFVVQDDNLGPYTLVGSDFLQNFGCKLIAVGLPQGIYCMPEDAEAFVGELFAPRGINITSIIDQRIQLAADAGMHLHEETAAWYQEFRSHATSYDLVLRTFLKDSEEWLASMEAEPGYQEYGDILEKIPFPEKIWVVEISWPQIFRHGRKLCGHVVIDPTDQVAPYLPTLDQGWLWMHVPGSVWYRNAQTGEIGGSILTALDDIRHHHFTNGK